MNEWVLLGVGLVLGGAAAWFAANSKVSELRSQIKQHYAGQEAKDRQIDDLQQQVRRESEQKVAAETKINQVQISLEEERALLQNAEAKLTDTFKALAADVLKDNSQSFVAMAKGELKTVQAEAKGDLETRQKAIDGLVNPLKESLVRYEKQIAEMEKSRENAYGSLENQLKSLQRVTGSLDVALRTPQVRGRWGEMTLRRVAELAGMSQHCDFTEQETLTGGTGQQRPDMIVNLPGGRRIAVDSKVPLQAFLDAASAASETDRRAHFARHGQQVRAHMNQLGAKKYWEQFDKAPDFVILFLPGESFFGAALEQDRSLIEDGMEKRVILATPTTLIVLLRAVAYGWREVQLAQNAQQISDLGKELYDRIRKFTEHFEGVGSALRKAVDTYNDATGSLERRVLISARKFKELGAATGEDIPEVESIEEKPRALAAGNQAE